MVTFAPQEPQLNAPQYWFMSRPISNVQADTSTEKLLKGGAEALTGGVNIAENFTEQSIRQETTQGLDKINNEAIERLNAAKANPALIDHDANELPAAVKGLPKDLDALDQARAHGKLSQSYVDMQKYQLAQSLRSRYAGHREFIDDSFGKSNRENPANQVVGQLIGDINSMAANADSKRTELKTLAIDALKRFPSSSGADVMVQGVMSGKVKEGPFLSWYWKYSAQDSDAKREDVETKRIETQDKFASQRGKEIITGRVMDRASDFFYNHQNATPGLQTPAEILKYHQDLSTGKIQPNDETASMKLQQIEQSKVQFLTEVDHMLDEHKPGELSYRALIGDPAAKELRESAAQRFTDMGKLFSDEKSGAGHLANIIVKSQADDTKYGLFNPKPGDPDADKTARFLRIFSALGHDAAPETLNKLMENALVTANYDEVLKRAIDGQNAAAVAQPNPQRPETIQATVAEMNSNPAVRKLTTEQKASAFNDAFSNVDILTNPKSNVTDKRHVATQFFDPSNRGVLGNFDVPSQMKLWDKLTNDKVAAEMHKLGGDSYSNYSSWVKDTFGTQLFNESIQTINKFGDLSNIKVTWENKDHQFNVQSTAVKAGPSGARGELPDPELRHVQDAVTNLNAGLKSVSSLSKYENLDPNAYILKLLIQSGIKEGLVHDMTKAVVNTGKVKNDTGN